MAGRSGLGPRAVGGPPRHGRGGGVVRGPRRPRRPARARGRPRPGPGRTPRPGPGRTPRPRARPGSASGLPAVRRACRGAAADRLGASVDVWRERPT
ncbi:hypothetical protein CP974_07685 [Streptomyces fradiae ATCC 10745 = DSM 40063]|nr:hypothetical protein CP974_07685 [Streptomyces fradiae ATCC 10745 = DSM 40063]